MSAANQLPYLMTVAEFLDWPTPDGSDRWELVDGVPVAMAPASDRHAMIHAETARLLGNHLVENRPDCRVLIEPGVQADEQNLRIPDVVVNCGPIDPTARLSAPLLIVEILSPSNWRRTWDNVLRYTATPSLAEVLVLHQSRVMAEVMRRDADGGWDEHLLLIDGDTVTLESIGFSAPLAAFYRTAA
jgi:Uma2 family endonuclease